MVSIQHSSRALRAFGGLALFAAALFGWSACGGDDNGPSPANVTDQAGRHCSVPFDAIEAPTCDAEPRPSSACGSGSQACFQLGTLEIAAQYKPAAICSACCNSTGSTGIAADCSGIVCKTDDDCPADYGSCNQGQCFMKR